MLKKETELIIEEYKERQRKKMEKRKEKKGKEKSEKEEKKEKDEDDKDEKEKDEKLKALSTKEAPAATDDRPKIFSLQKSFYQMRIDRIRNAELARRNRERLKDPASFPAAPKGDL